MAILIGLRPTHAQSTAFFEARFSFIISLIRGSWILLPTRCRGGQEKRTLEGILESGQGLLSFRNGIEPKQHAGVELDLGIGEAQRINLAGLEHSLAGFAS